MLILTQIIHVFHRDSLMPGAYFTVQDSKLHMFIRNAFGSDSRNCSFGKRCNPEVETFGFVHPLNSMKVLYSNVTSSIDARNADTIEENLYPIDDLCRRNFEKCLTKCDMSKRELFTSISIILLLFICGKS